MDRFFPYGRQSIDSADIAAVTGALKEEIITRGRHVEEFEEALAERCSVEYAVAFSSGTAALQAAYFAAGVGSNDRMYTTPNTFFATAGAAVALGARVVFIDIDRRTGNIDLEQLEANMNVPHSRGKNVVVPVHFSGIPVDMERLESRVALPDTVVIEDAAHAIGSRYCDGSPVGCCLWSDMTIFSFHPVKTITCGEGGAVTTKDRELYHLLRRFRNNGIEREPAHFENGGPSPWRGYHEVCAVTGNYNVTDFQAALGMSQLRRLDLFVEHRRALVQRYRHHLMGLQHLRLFDASADERTAYHLFVVQVDFEACQTTRARFVEELHAAGIGTQLHYIPLYRHPAMRHVVGDIAAYFPAMEGYYASALTLPLYYDLQLEEVDFIAATLKSLLKSRATLPRS